MNVRFIRVFCYLIFALSISFDKCFVACFKEWWEDSKVPELNSDNFFDHVGTDKYVIVKFYTKWCKYCRVLSPTYEKFYELMNKNRKDVLVARLEAESNEEIPDEFEISSFPKIVLFHPDSVEIHKEFKWERSLDRLSAWVDKYAPVREQKSQLKEKVEKMEHLKILNQEEDYYKASLISLKDEIKYLKEKYLNLTSSFQEIKNIKKFQNIILRDNNYNNNNSPVSNYKIVVTILIFFVMLSAYITIRKIYSKIS